MTDARDLDPTPSRRAPEDDAGRTLSEAVFERFELLGVSSAVKAALRHGILEVLLEGRAHSPVELAETLGLRAKLLECVLGVLATTGLVRGGDDEARYRSGPVLDALGRHGDAFVDLELSVWDRLSSLLEDETPESGQGGSGGDRAAPYAGIADDLSLVAAPAARRLAAEIDPSCGRVLDVGCGAGAWSLALARTHRGIRVTGLDLPEVTPRFEERARGLGLEDRVTTRSGDMHEVQLEAEEFDLVLLANVLRLEPPPRARDLVGRLADAVAPGGALLVVDAFPGRTARGRRLHATYRLHLALRCPGAETPDPDELATWLREEGLGPLERVDPGPDGLFGALLARRRE